MSFDIAGNLFAEVKNTTFSIKKRSNIFVYHLVYPHELFTKNAYKSINNHEWVENEFLPRVQQRGAENIQARGASSASSAARAACETVKAVEHPTRSGDVFNAAVMSDGAYGMPEGIFSGFPLISDGSGSIEIVRDYSLSDFAKAGLKKTADELVAERNLVKDLI